MKEDLIQPEIVNNIKELNIPLEADPPYVKRAISVPPSILLREGEHPLLRDFYITWTGYYEKAYGHILNLRILEDEYCLLYCIDGFGHFSSQDKCFLISPGDAFFLFKGVPHSYYADEMNPWTKYWIGFSGAHSKHYLDLLKVSPQNPVIHMGLHQGMLQDFQEVLDVLKNGFHTANLLHAATCLQSILSRLIDLRFDESLTLSNTTTINDVIEIMLANLGRPLTLEELSQSTGVSKYHLSRKFHEKTGYPPLEYFNRLKIQRACELLNISGVKVKDVGESLGFSTPYYFSQVFKKYTSMAPNQFKKYSPYFQVEYVKNLKP